MLGFFKYNFTPDSCNNALPGVNAYLEKEFRKRLSDKGEVFKHVYPLTMISFDFLFRNISRIGLYRFKDFIKLYHRKIKANNKRMSKSDGFDFLIPSYTAIEHTPTKFFQGENEDFSSKGKKINKFLDQLNMP